MKWQERLKVRIQICLAVNNFKTIWYKKSMLIEAKTKVPKSYAHIFLWVNSYKYIQVFLKKKKTA